MPVTPPRTLVAFFSRAGENHHYGRRLWLEVGNTEVLVGLLASLVGVDVHPIVPAEPYPTDYEETSPRTPGNRTRTVSYTHLTLPTSDLV